MLPKKIFTIKKISLITFLFGPVAGTFLIASNFQELGESKLAKRTIILGILLTFILFALLSSITYDVLGNLASLSIPPLYLAIIAYVSSNLQNNQIKAYLEKGGQTASTLSAFGIGFSGLFVAIVIFIGVEALDEKVKYKKIEIGTDQILFYERNIPDNNSLRLSRILKDSGFLDDVDQIEVYLDLEDDKYQLRFILIDPTILKDTAFTNELNSYEKFLNYNGNLDKPLEINFLDQFLTKTFSLPDYNEESVPYEILLYLNRYQISDNHTIYHDITVPLKDIDVIAESVKNLKGYFPPDQVVDIIFLNYEDHYTIKLFILKESWTSKPLIDRLKSTVDYFQKNGITKPIKIFLIDNKDFAERQI